MSGRDDGLTADESLSAEAFACYVERAADDERALRAEVARLTAELAERNDAYEHLESRFREEYEGRTRALQEADAARAQLAEVRRAAREHVLAVDEFRSRLDSPRDHERTLEALRAVCAPSAPAESASGLMTQLQQAAAELEATPPNKRVPRLRESAPARREAEACPECHMPRQHKLQCSRRGLPIVAEPPAPRESAEVTHAEAADALRYIVHGSPRISLTAYIRQQAERERKVAALCEAIDAWCRSEYEESESLLDAMLAARKDLAK